MDKFLQTYRSFFSSTKRALLLVIWLVFTGCSQVGESNKATSQSEDTAGGAYDKDAIAQEEVQTSDSEDDAWDDNVESAAEASEREENWSDAATTETVTDSTMFVGNRDTYANANANANVNTSTADVSENQRVELTEGGIHVPTSMFSDRTENALESSLEGSPLLHDTLSKRELKAFENKAEQKVNDFTDYLVMLNDPKYDREFQQHIWNLMQETLDSAFFYTGMEYPGDTADLENTFRFYSDLMRDDGRNAHLQKLTWESKPAKSLRNGLLVYKGVLNRNVVLKAGPADQNIMIVIAKYPKVVGSASIDTWQVKIASLANIYQR